MVVVLDFGMLSRDFLGWEVGIDKCCVNCVASWTGTKARIHMVLCLKWRGKCVSVWFEWRKHYNQVLSTPFNCILVCFVLFGPLFEHAWKLRVATHALFDDVIGWVYEGMECKECKGGSRPCKWLRCWKVAAIRRSSLSYGILHGRQCEMEKYLCAGDS